MPATPETARIVRVFVSSPSDVAEERAVLDEVVDRINRTDGRRTGLRLELWTWERDVVPQIGPKPQEGIDAQIPGYDVYLGILAHRFGTKTGRYGSGTEKEFRDALKRWGSTGAPWILFYFSDAPIRYSKTDLAEVQRVAAFRKKIESKGLYATYEGVRGDRNAFYEQVDDHLRKIVEHFVSSGPELHVDQSVLLDPTGYLRDLRDKTGHIDIRGLRVGSGKAHRFPIEQLFITLTTVRSPRETASERGKRRRGPKPEPGKLVDPERTNVPLHEALQCDRLMILGPPGAGKTTFLRRIAHALCQTRLGDVPKAAAQRVAIGDRTFPIFIRLSELAKHLDRTQHDRSPPVEDDAAAWLPHFLEAASRTETWALTAEFFRQELTNGLCTVLLDGLDEAPDAPSRERLARIVENAARSYPGCRFVVSTRPAAYTDEVSLPGFVPARIEPLSREAVEAFLQRWCDALYDAETDASRRHRTELVDALRARPEIRRMANNPVMLTALAVVHWNQKKLPEQRAELYESIIGWLSQSRKYRPRRPTAERAVFLLQELALAMQHHPKGMQTDVSKRWAAEQLAREFPPGKLTKDTIASAERFLNAEEIDSGIIELRGNEIRFWHRTFQEFLAARGIDARPDAQQTKLLWGPPAKVYLSEWHEVMLLLAGVLHRHGPAKVDKLVRSMLRRVDPEAPLSEQARAAGLLGAMIRDLEPAEYQPPGHQYQALMQRVMGIFALPDSTDVPVTMRIAVADAIAQAGDPRIDFHGADYYVTIPAGRFVMGAQTKNNSHPNYDPEAFDSEAPPHEVFLDEYRIARYPVTVGQFRPFIEDEAYDDPQWWTAGGFGEFREPKAWEDQLPYPSRPVGGVSWFEAMAFCAWAHVQLPTEAQWERAARGTDGRKFPWGDQPADESRLNYARGEFPNQVANVGHPTPVGIYPLGNTPEGICDMAGNVWEWCADWFGKYPRQAASNPTGAEKGESRVNRGGSWASVARNCRSAYRRGSEPALRSDDLGFRVSPVPPG